jgi:hypothetical protein
LLLFRRMSLLRSCSRRLRLRSRLLSILRRLTPLRLCRLCHHGRSHRADRVVLERRMRGSRWYIGCSSTDDNGPFLIRISLCRCCRCIRLRRRSCRGCATSRMAQACVRRRRACTHVHAVKLLHQRLRSIHARMPSMNGAVIVLSTAIVLVMEILFTILTAGSMPNCWRTMGVRSGGFSWSPRPWRRCGYFRRRRLR